MKVCLLINSFNLGGAEKLMYDMAAALEAKGVEVHLVAMKKAETELEKKIFAKLLDKNFRVGAIDKPVGSGKVKSVLAIRKYLKKNKIDVLHTNGQSPDFYGRLATVIYPKTKNLVTIHNTMGYSRKIEKLFGFITDAYSAVSKQAAEYTAKTLGVKKSIAVVDNSIDVSRYEKTADKSEKFRILSVGRVVKQKGYVNVAARMSDYLTENPDAEWVIVGEMHQDEKYLESLLKLIDEKVKDRVVLTGAVTNPEEHYKSADCFLLPSENEGFGIAYIEAMAAKLPVICNKVGVILDVEKMNGKFFDLGEKDLCECINESRNMNAEEIEKNYILCRDNYSLEAKAQQYIEIYENLKRR